MPSGLPGRAGAFAESTESTGSTGGTARTATPALPAVSVVMPVLNEERHLADAVAHVLEQDYPAAVEVVLAVGPSRDRTLEVAHGLAAADPRITVVENPSGQTPAGLNAAIAASHNPVVARVDGHALLPPGYLRIAAETLAATGADNVGGIMAADGRHPVRAGRGPGDDVQGGRGRGQVPYRWRGGARRVGVPRGVQARGDRPGRRLRRGVPACAGLGAESPHPYLGRHGLVPAADAGRATGHGRTCARSAVSTSTMAGGAASWPASTGARSARVIWRRPPR